MKKIDKRRVRLSCLRSMLYDDVRYIKELSYLTEHFLRKEYLSIIHPADREINEELSEFEKRFDAECLASDIEKVQEVFPRILRYSLFVTSMAKFEYGIVSLCKGAKNIFELTSEFNTKNKPIIKLGIEYLKTQKGLEINTKKFDDRIELMENYRIIRNCIVHSDGVITRKEDEERLRQFIKESRTFNIDRHNRIILIEGFVNGVAHSMELLWDRLLNAIEVKIDVQ